MTKTKNTLKDIVPILTTQSINNEIIHTVSVEELLFAATCFKYHINYQYSLLSCISGVDLINKKYRFCVVYEFLSLCFNSNIRIKTFVNEITSINSLVTVYVNANWWEREVWDMFGIYFNNHPDLRRILTDYGFEGHPMRKDFPLSGFIELRYDETKKRIVVEQIELTQNFRVFNFVNPWTKI